MGVSIVRFSEYSQPLENTEVVLVPRKKRCSGLGGRRPLLSTSRLRASGLPVQSHSSDALVKTGIIS